MNWKLFGFYVVVIVGLICATFLFWKQQPCAALIIIFVVGGASYKEMPPNSRSTQTAANATDDGGEKIKVNF